VYVPSTRAILPPQYGLAAAVAANGGGGAAGAGSGYSDASNGSGVSTTASGSTGSSATSVWTSGHHDSYSHYGHGALTSPLYAQNVMMPWRAYDASSFQRSAHYGTSSAERQI